MTFHDDPDLERRLRHIAEAPQPSVPGSVFEYAGEVTREKRGSKVRFSLGVSFGRGPVRLASAIGIAAALVVAVALASVLLSARSNQPGSTPSMSPSSSASLSSSAVPVATPSASSGPSETVGPSGTPAPTMTATGFTSSGMLTGWKAFSWTKLAAGNPILGDTTSVMGSGVTQVLKWRAGYVATGSIFGNSDVASTGLWTSPDGGTWTPVTSIHETGVRVSVAPAGLIAIGVDPITDALGSTWTSSNGSDWTNAGTPNFGGTLLSIAGTDTGIVATVSVTTGTGKFATGDYFVEYSTDGVTWSPETIDSGMTWNASAPAPRVQSNAGRFFLLGSAASPVADAGAQPRMILAASVAPPSYVWWSDDGRTWTRSAGSFQATPQSIEFGRDGMLLNTRWDAVPGGTELARSTDGGKTWIPDGNFGPLGQVSCTGECGTGGDGVIGSNGTIFVAVKNAGKKAWLSYDGLNWTSITWNGGDPGVAGLGSFLVMPRGVVLGNNYGAAN